MIKKDDKSVIQLKEHSLQAPLGVALFESREAKPKDLGLLQVRLVL